MLGALVLAAFIKLLFATDSPRFCAGLYTVLVAVDALVGIAVGSVGAVGAVLAVVHAGVLSWVYFRALQLMNPWTGPWWAVAVGGPILAVTIAACID